MAKDTITKVELGDYLTWNMEMAKVVAETDRKTFTIEFMDEGKCPGCGTNLGKRQINVIVDSPLFQNCAAPIPTIK